MKWSTGTWRCDAVIAGVNLKSDVKEKFRQSTKQGEQYAARRYLIEQ